MFTEDLELRFLFVIIMKFLYFNKWMTITTWYQQYMYYPSANQKYRLAFKKTLTDHVIVLNKLTACCLKESRHLPKKASCFLTGLFLTR